MPPSQFAGLGPFRLKEYVAGQRVVLERNPYYWKADRAGNQLPYLNEVTFLFVPSEDAQVIRFQSGDTDILSRFSADNFAVLQKQQSQKGYHLDDLGAGLEYNFLFFNLNDPGPNIPPEIDQEAGLVSGPALPPSRFRGDRSRRNRAPGVQRPRDAHLGPGNARK